MKAGRPVLILAAMDREFSGLRAALDARSDDAVSNFYPRWTTADRAITIVQTHVGDVDAAIAATAAVTQLRPAMVLKLGCVGGHSPGVHAGDVVVPMRIFHSGAWIARTRDAAQWQPIFGDLPHQVNRENLGGRDAVLSVDESLTAAWMHHLRDHGVAFTHAHVGSANMWFFDHVHMAHVLDASLPDDPLREWVADMESYAIARACAVARVPFSGIYRAANSEFHCEPYVPDAVTELFTDRFAALTASFVRKLADAE